MSKFLSICLSSTIQRTIDFEKVELTQVNRSKNYRMDASGKAVNSSRVLNQLEKGCVTTICPVGKKNSSLFVDLAKADCLNMTCVEIPGFTRECWTLLDYTAGTTTELVVGEPELNADELKEVNKAQERILKLINSQIDNVDGILLAGSRPVIWDENLYSKISFLCASAGKIFLADFWGKDLLNTLKTSIPSIIKINDDEFCKTFDVENSNEQALKDSIIQKSKELQNIVVVTRGTKSTFAADKGTFYECPCQKVKAINTTACGDSFNAGFLYEYVNSKDISKALDKGTWCAARNAERTCPGSIN